jgi:hypothetical protein
MLQFECLSPLNEEDADGGNIDVHVTLDDGREFTLVLATPKNIYTCMDNVAVDYFYGVPPLFVRKLTLSNIEAAIRSIAEDEDGKWLNVYGG